MKVIKNILLLIIAIQFISCEKEDDKRFTQENQSFVRFFLLVASNNEVLEFPNKDGNLLAATSYAKDNLKTLKIPVAITAAKIDNPVTISFSTSVTGLSNYTITPVNSLTFTNEKRIDTIYIKVNKNWDLTKNPQIKLTLTESSNTDVIIGIPNENIPNNEDLENWYGNNAFANVYSRGLNSVTFIDVKKLDQPDFRLRINNIIAISFTE